MTWIDTPWQRPQDCTCPRVWHGVTQPPPCPVHGGVRYVGPPLNPTGVDIVVRESPPQFVKRNRAIRAEDV